MNDRFDSQVSPLNDFVDDSAAIRLTEQLGMVGLALFVAVAIIVGVVAYNRAAMTTRNALLSLFHDVLRLIKKMVLGAAKAPQGKIEKESLKILDAYDHFFKHTHALGYELEKAMKPLNAAIEGVRVLPAPAGGGLGPSQVSGGTVINIAVSNGVAAVGDAAPPQINTPSSSAIGNLNHPVYLDRMSTLRRLVLQISNEWANLQVIVSLFKAAQNQLTKSARPPERPQPAGGHASGKD